MNKIIILITFAISQLSLAETLTLTKGRVVKIEGQVKEDVTAVAREIRQLADKSKSPIYLIINTPGGAVEPGLRVLDSIRYAKEGGSRVVCIVDGLTMSIGFIFLSECSERYSTAYSLLMWHPVKSFYMGLIGVETADNLSTALSEVERPLIKMQREALGMEEKLFMRHYKLETIHVASGLIDLVPNFMKIINRYVIEEDPTWKLIP